jgi:tetratricopeptide (TPR) repeat protein
MVPTREAATQAMERAHAAIGRRRLNEALSEFIAAAEIAAKVPECEQTCSDAWREAAEIRMRLGQWDRAIEDVLASRDAAANLGDERLLAEAENLLGVIEYERGNWHEASRRYGVAREHAGTIGDEHLLVEIETNEGLLWTALGDRQRAKESLDWALSRFEELDYDNCGPRLLSNMGTVLAGLGRTDEADALFDRAVDECKRRLDLYLGAKVMMNRARLALDQGDLIRAHTLAKTVQSFCEWFSSSSLEAETVFLLGAIAGRMGYSAEAEKSLKRALEMCADGRAPNCEAEAWAELGELLIGQDRNQEALEAWREARRCYRSLGANLESLRLGDHEDPHGHHEKLRIV